MHEEPARSHRDLVERALQDEESLHRTSSVPKFGLPSEWAGIRQTGESSVRRSSTNGQAVEQFEVIELVHGDLQAGPSLRVATGHHDPNDQSELRGLLHDELRSIRQTVPGREDMDPESELAGSVVDRIAVVVGDSTAEFEVMSAASAAVGRAELGAYTVTLKARAWPITDELMLVAVADLDPYIDGRRRAVAERTGR